MAQHQQHKNTYTILEDNEQRPSGKQRRIVLSFDSWKAQVNRQRTILQMKDDADNPHQPNQAKNKNNNYHKKTSHMRINFVHTNQLGYLYECWAKSQDPLSKMMYVTLAAVSTQADSSRTVPQGIEREFVPSWFGSICPDKMPQDSWAITSHTHATMNANIWQAVRECWNELDPKSDSKAILDQVKKALHMIFVPVGVPNQEVLQGIDADIDNLIDGSFRGDVAGAILVRMARSQDSQDEKQEQKDQQLMLLDWDMTEKYVPLPASPANAVAAQNRAQEDLSEHLSRLVAFLALALDQATTYNEYKHQLNSHHHLGALVGIQPTVLCMYQPIWPPHSSVDQQSLRLAAMVNVNQGTAKAWLDSGLERHREQQEAHLVKMVLRTKVQEAVRNLPMNGDSEKEARDLSTRLSHITRKGVTEMINLHTNQRERDGIGQIGEQTSNKNNNKKNKKGHKPLTNNDQPKNNVGP
jgi:hypothetical protein